MTDVVIIEAPEPEPTEPVVVPSVPAVSSGELDARIELLETTLGDRINTALDEAFAARMSADQAQETAETAAVIAAVAAEQSAEEPESAGADEDTGADSGAGESEDDGVRPPERRKEHAQKDAGGGNSQPSKKASGYGAGWLSGR